jgi:hypothetical protein
MSDESREKPASDRGTILLLLHVIAIVAILAYVIQTQ